MSDGGFVALEFPAWISWGQRRGATLPQPEGRGANGRPFCRWCAAEVPGKRLSWCSDECAHRFLRVFTWAAVREYVMERDGFTCQRCGTPYPGWRRTKIAMGWREIGQHCELIEDWQVDHILPVRNGGTDDPANLRLLCHACHVAAGYDQRRDEKPQLELSA